MKHWFQTCDLLEPIKPLHAITSKPITHLRFISSLNFTYNKNKVGSRTYSPSLLRTQEIYYPVRRKYIEKNKSISTVKA